MFQDNRDKRYVTFASVTTPTVLVCWVNPETIKETHDPKYTTHTAPAGRFGKHVYTGMGSRVLTFDVIFDTHLVQEGAAGPHSDPPLSFPDSVTAGVHKLKSGREVKRSIRSVLDAFTLLKTPQILTLNKLSGEGWFRETISSRQPGPPLTLLKIGGKIYAGYVSGDITIESFNELLQPIRATVNVSFLVQEGNLWSIIDDAAKLVNSGFNSFHALTALSGGIR